MIVTPTFGMKRKRIIVFSLTAFLVYLPFSPVFTTSVYGTQPRSHFPGSDDYAYLWIDRSETFQSCLLFGLWRFKLRDGVHLMFRSEQGGLKTVKIAVAHAEIDGQESPLPQVAGKDVELDFSKLNMYGGKGGSGFIKFNLPDVPADFVRLNIGGTAITTDGSERPFAITVQSKVVKEQSTMCLYQYVVAQLTKT